MKYFKAVLKYAAIAYTLGSLALSVASSTSNNVRDYLACNNSAFFVVDTGFFDNYFTGDLEFRFSASCLGYYLCDYNTMWNLR